MRIMDVVWPLTALYSGPLGGLAYRRWGRLNSPRYRQQSGARGRYPFSVSVGKATPTAAPGVRSGT
jgi:hypothetical protein